MQSFIDKIKTEFTLPEINGDRCVHAHIETATCEACVDACPTGAWILDDESLGLNTSACDGCGLCVPACSEGAITQLQDFTIREESNNDKSQKKALLLGCDQTGLDEKNCKCVNAFTYNELLKLYREGIQHVFLKTGDCDQCPRGKNERLQQRVNNINSVLLSRQLPKFKIKELPTDLWQQLWKTPEKAAPGPEITRRMFFRSAIEQTIDKVMNHSSVVSNAEFVPVGELLPISTNKNVIYPHVPHLDTAKCNGCDACINACPHNALQLLIDSPLSYSLDAKACTACLICVDICDQDAIQVSDWSTSKQALLALETQRCKSCGVDFHYPKSQSTDNDNVENKRFQCNICSQINHSKNLFRVMQ